MPVVEEGRFDELFILVGPVPDIRSDGQTGSTSAIESGHTRAAFSGLTVK
jgi:hypothetical protein